LLAELSKLLTRVGLAPTRVGGEFIEFLIGD
jgi:hypothetical protein